MVIPSQDGFRQRNVKKQAKLLVITEGEKDFISIESIRGGALPLLLGRNLIQV